jgi:hypothetical protein
MDLKLEVISFTELVFCVQCFVRGQEKERYMRSRTGGGGVSSLEPAIETRSRREFSRRAKTHTRSCRGFSRKAITRTRARRVVWSPRPTALSVGHLV